MLARGEVQDGQTAAWSFEYDPLRHGTTFPHKTWPLFDSTAVGNSDLDILLVALDLFGFFMCIPLRGENPDYKRETSGV